MSDQRPQLSASISAAEFRRWYWLKSELRDFARRLGVSASGAKADIADRIAHQLNGGSPGTAPSPARRPAGPQLAPPLRPETVIPAGQRCTAVVRAFMVEQVGSSFRFDAHMREFFAAAGGKTLADAVAHWDATRDLPAPQIAAQFEYNTFVRDYRRSHPDATHAQVVAAWHDHRALPRDSRPPV